MKVCKDCGKEKDNSDFYGKQGECKECTKARVRKYRAENIERVREYDRNRPNAEERNELNKFRYKENMKNPEYREKDRQRIKTWQEKNHIKRAAHVITGNAIRDGRLIKQPCEVCGEVQVNAHHDDYEKPLQVRWLCKKHHAEHHKTLREIERNKF